MYQCADLCAVFRAAWGKSVRCGNCAAFDQTDKIMDCMIKGINETMAADPQDVLDRANLGYCQLFEQQTFFY